MATLKEATPAGGAAAFVSDEDLFVNAKGELVGKDSPDKQTLVAKAGVPISRAAARAYGLIEDDVSREQKKTAEEQKKRTEADRAAATGTGDKTEIIVGKSAGKAADKSAAKTEDKGASSSPMSTTPPATTTPGSSSSSEAPKA